MSASLQTERRGILDPVERASEVLFGLIMVLSFTCSISVANAGHEDVRSVLIGAIGCNLAWGIVDAIMYLMTILLERGRQLSIGRAVRASADPVQGRQFLVQALPEPLDQLFDDEALESARKKLCAVPPLRERPHLSNQDGLGALGVFLLVFLSTFPVVLPFLLFSPVHTAMRVSNGVAIALLFITGQLLARYAGLRRVRTGLVMVAVGVAMVALTIALGG
jgi:hypothetical protein